MSLAELIRGKSTSGGPATATRATLATLEGMEGQTVASVATVAVANANRATVESAAAWLLHFTDRDPLEVHFFPEATHTEALAAYPDAVAAEPIKIVVPVRACRDCRHQRRPGLSDPGYCARRTDTPHAYGPNHPLHRLPEDGGTGCNAFEDRT